MKALVLAAGKGRRLLPFTHTIPKPLLPVANKPIVVYALEQIKEAGISEVGIIVSPLNGDLLQEALGDGARWGLKITYISQPEPLGTAHAVKMAEEFLEGADFLLFLGDCLTHEPIRDFVTDFRAHSADGFVILKRVDDPRGLGVVELDEAGDVVKLTEKPKRPKSDLILTGIYLFTSEVHRAIDGIKPSARGELEITDAIQRLLDTGKEVRSHILKGWWLDAGSREDFLEANRVMLKEFLRRKVKGKIDKDSRAFGRVEIGKGTIVENSVIHDPTSVAEACRIKNATIGAYTSIAAGTVIEDSTVGDSVVLEGASITGAGAIYGAIIGRNTVITRRQPDSQAIRLFVGDDARVEI